MQIINDTEVFEPSECYFEVCSEPDDPDTGEHRTMIYITGIEFWKESECLDDCFGDHSLPKKVTDKLLEYDIGSEMEATWSSSFSKEKTREIMLDLGFVEKIGIDVFTREAEND